jgi:hypothetical protein
LYDFASVIWKGKPGPTAFHPAGLLRSSFSSKPGVLIGTFMAPGVPYSIWLYQGAARRGNRSCASGIGLGRKPTRKSRSAVIHSGIVRKTGFGYIPAGVRLRRLFSDLVNGVASDRAFPWWRASLQSRSSAAESLAHFTICSIGYVMNHEDHGR